MFSPSLDASSLQILLAVVGFLLLCAVFRIIQISRHNRRMQREIAKLEDVEGKQPHEVETLLRDADSWREGMRRHLDTLRTDFNARLQQSEAGNSRLQQQLDSALEGMLTDLQTRTTTTEKPRLFAPPRPEPPPPAQPSSPTLPSLPTLETLRLHTLENELITARTEIASLRQKSLHLQSALSLARRRRAQPRQVTARKTR